MINNQLTTEEWEKDRAKHALFETFCKFGIAKRPEIFMNYTFVGTGLTITMPSSYTNVAVDGVAFKPTHSGSFNVSGLPHGIHTVKFTK